MLMTKKDNMFILPNEGDSFEIYLDLLQSAKVDVNADILDTIIIEGGKLPTVEANDFLAKLSPLSIW